MAQNFSRDRNIFRREEIFQVRIGERQRAIFVGSERRFHTVRFGDDVGGEESRHAAHIIMRANSQHKADLWRVRRLFRRQQGKASGKTQANHADGPVHSRAQHHG